MTARGRADPAWAWHWLRGCQGLERCSHAEPIHFDRLKLTTSSLSCVLDLQLPPFQLVLRKLLDVTDHAIQHLEVVLQDAIEM